MIFSRHRGQNENQQGPTTKKEGNNERSDSSLTAIPTYLLAQRVVCCDDIHFWRLGLEKITFETTDKGVVELRSLGTWRKFVFPFIRFRSWWCNNYLGSSFWCFLLVCSRRLAWMVSQSSDLLTPFLHQWYCRCYRSTQSTTPINANKVLRQRWHVWNDGGEGCEAPHL